MNSLGLVCVSGVSFCVFGVAMMPLLHSPGLLLGLFLVLVVFSSLLCSLLISNLLPYMLFLVYVGGLLVLMIYLILLTSNLRAPDWGGEFFSGGLLCGGLSVWLAWPGPVLCSESAVLLRWESTSLFVLGSVLTLLFLGVCNILSVGGSSLIVGKAT